MVMKITNAAIIGFASTLSDPLQAIYGCFPPTTEELVVATEGLLSWEYLLSGPLRKICQPLF